MKQERESFVFYKNWDDSIRKAPPQLQVELYHALFDYAYTGKRPDNLSWEAEMVLTLIEKNLKNAIERYDAKVENGKRGGRPTQKNETETNQTKTEPNQAVTELNQNQTESNQAEDFGEVEKPNRTEKKPNQNQTKPNDNLTKTKQNQTEPKQNLNDYDYVNVNVNDNVFSSSQSIKSPARTREVSPKSEVLRNFWKERFADFWTFGITPARDKLGMEVIDTLIEALEQSASKKNLKFNKTTYCYSALSNLFLRLKEEDFRDIVWSLQATEDIQSRPWYLLGALINRAEANEPYAGIRLDALNFEKLLKEASDGTKGN